MTDKPNNLKRRERQLVKELREEGLTDWQSEFLSKFKKNHGNVAQTCRDLKCRRSKFDGAFQADHHFASAVNDARVELLDAIESFLIEESLKDPQIALKVMAKLRKQVWGDSKDLAALQAGEVEEANVVEVFEFKGNKLSFPKKKSK